MSEETSHQVNLPQNFEPLNDSDRKLLFDFYGKYSPRQWFNRAEIILRHPRQMKKTLEIYCNYNPLLEMKDILTFTQRYDLGLEIIDLSHQGTHFADGKQ